MSAYPALVAAIQQRRSLMRAILVRLDFTSGTLPFWVGAPLPARESPTADAAA